MGFDSFWGGAKTAILRCLLLIDFLCVSFSFFKNFPSTFSGRGRFVFGARQSFKKMVLAFPFLLAGISRGRPRDRID